MFNSITLIFKTQLLTLVRCISFIIFPFFSLNANVERPYVSCRLEGQLGNQLFEIATTLAYAWDYHLEPIFPDLNSKGWNIPHNRGMVFFRLNASALPRPPLKEFYERECYQDWPDNPPYFPDCYLRGYFQSWIYFHHHRQKILEIFAPPKEIDDFLQSNYEDLLAHPNTVAVHVRTYDKVVHSHGATPFLGLDYYREAMNLFPKETLFVVFSDRINWCKHHFEQLNKNIIYIDNGYVEDLFLMSKLKHQIIANSTFSWWGAYLNTNPDQIVVTPRYWMNPILRHFPLEESNSLYLPHWISINSDCNKNPYPIDIGQYDPRSKSID